MKLLSKYNRVNIFATIIVLLLGAGCYFYFIRSVLFHQLDKDLKAEEREITDFVRENHTLPEASNFNDEQEIFLPLNGEQITRNFKSIAIFNKEDNENVLYRQLEFPITAGGISYKIQIRKSQEETDDLVQLILTITIAIIIVLLIMLFFINRFFLNKLWKPFNTTLKQIKQFNLSGKEKIHLEDSNITEFRELNQAVGIMTSRVIQDYGEIKSFTENASHEIQTPLSIITSKLELLSQSESLKEDQMNAIQSIHDATNRLSKLNQSLILLTKIDNQQFRESEQVNISDLINKHFVNYEELIAAKLITVRKTIENDIKLNMNEALAEILISNLVTNAIKHNITGGTIEINLNSKQLSIGNSGLPLDSDPNEMFERFKKDKVNSESLGLGLSIVKKICDKYRYNIRYTYSDNFHKTQINF